MRAWAIVFVSVSICALTCVAHAVPLIYTGHTISFSKAAFGDPFEPSSQDPILNDIVITRAVSGGIFNVAVEDLFTSNSSPAGTEWAFKSNNPVNILAATNWQVLDFTDWQTALGGSGSLATNILEGNAVLRLVDQEIVLDIRFTAWGVGGGAGGSFTYERAEITPTADFDRDGDVDGRDFLTWQRGFGKSDPLQMEGDADFSGTIDGNDLAIWQASYGSPLIAMTAVPEPGALLLISLASLWFAGLRLPSERQLL